MHQLRKLRIIVFEVVLNPEEESIKREPEMWKLRSTGLLAVRKFTVTRK